MLRWNRLLPILVPLALLVASAVHERALGGQPAAPGVQSPHGRLEASCEECHTAQSWTSVRAPLAFDHDKTGFPLAGKHRTAACKSCHASLVFSRVATSCADCHRDVHQGRNGPRCQDCHSPERWVDRSDAVRRHAATGFPLQGVHALLECSRCHGGQGEANIQKLASDCAACHAADYAAAANPNHVASSFSTRCEDCHTAASSRWGGAGFEHAATGFPLTGAHRALVCSACHSGGTFTGARSDCVACHQTDFDRTQDPNHAASGFGTICTQCHTTSAWRPASFDHNASGFPLTGAHRTVTCASCHPGGQYTGTPSDCVACHRADFDGTQNPNHAASGFGTNCTQCHTTSAWSPASFDHSASRFPLTGAHRSVACVSCHPGGQFTGTPSDCVACHRDDFDGTQNPNHTASGFGTTCTQCHTTSAWRPANWNHDAQYFRINSGQHRGKWQSCATCHPNSSNYADFTCFQCHEHDQTRTDEKHREVRGYRYESTACLACHRNV